MNPLKIGDMKTLKNILSAALTTPFAAFKKGSTGAGTGLLIALVALLATSCVSMRERAYANNHWDDYFYEDYRYSYGGGISLQVFYDALNPHGRWLNSSIHGPVWIPNVPRNFHPYATNGYWVMTNYGNTWVSNYSWGWAPFHYGRWFLDDYYGWAWVPGYEWAPAWVAWRGGGGYYGWAPLGPGVNISININLPGSWWTFLPNRHMYHRNINNYYIGYTNSLYSRTTIINNVYIYNENNYWGGPSPDDFYSATGRRTTVHRLESSSNEKSTGVTDNVLKMYRPESGGERAANRSATAVERNTQTGTTTRSSTTQSGTTRSSGTTTRSSSTTQSSTSRSSGTTTTRSSSTESGTSRSSGTTTTTRSSSTESGTSRSSGTTTRSSSTTGSGTTRSSGTTTTRSSSTESGTTRSSGSGRSSGSTPTIQRSR